MPYTNELVTEADIDQFNLKTLWKRYYFVFTGRSWIIDRAGHSYLLLGRRNPEDLSVMASADSAIASQGARAGCAVSVENGGAQGGPHGLKKQRVEQLQQTASLASTEGKQEFADVRETFGSPLQ
jgi:hypothetical protein